MRQTAHFTCPDWAQWQPRIMQWLRAFDHFVYLDSNSQSQDPYHRFDVLIGAGVHQHFPLDHADTFSALQHFYDTHSDWIMGYFTYDLKNEIEQLVSRHEDGMGWPKAGFFVPEVVLYLQGDTLTISSLGSAPAVIWSALERAPDMENWSAPAVSFHQRMGKDYYLHSVRQLQEHIAAGDVYEVNFTQEWYARQVRLDPYPLFQAFDELGNTPFAAFMRFDSRYLLCQSPERFLAKRARQLISQPIKGTIGRGTTREEDEKLAQELLNNEKERAENVMIVDLVRNDLARSAVTGTVEVPELFGVYRFPSVHQMISTVTATLRDETPLATAIRNAFPMGSMTGAPKVMAMELIERYEKSKRGLYSGAVGYIDPHGNFDFNVVIRSLQYFQSEGYLSYQTGGAITWDSDPEQEYAESLLKASGMRKLFS